MEFKIECPWCKQHYSVDDSFVGQKIECSVCGRYFTVGNPPDSQNYNPPPPPQCSHPIQQRVVYIQAQSRAKSRGIYVMLGVLLGNLGIHNFYAGHIARGVAHLGLELWFFLFFLNALSIAEGEYAQFRIATSFLMFGIASFVNTIWALVEIFTIKNDGKGIPME